MKPVVLSADKDVCLKRMNCFPEYEYYNIHFTVRLTVVRCFRQMDVKQVANLCWIPELIFNARIIGDRGK